MIGKGREKGKEKKKERKGNLDAIKAKSQPGSFSILE